MRQFWKSPGKGLLQGGFVLILAMSMWFLFSDEVVHAQNDEVRDTYRLPIAGSHSISAGPNGCHNSYHTGSSNEAIDFPMSSGTPVYAIADGNVLYARWSSGGYGWLVKVEHSNGDVSFYAHSWTYDSLGAILVLEGEPVSRGDILAFSGNSGNSTGPHLHFEVQDNQNRPVNVRNLPGISWHSGDSNNPCDRPGYLGTATGPNVETPYNSDCPTYWNNDIQGMTLFSEANCLGTKLHIESPGLYNLSDYSFDNLALSVYINNRTATPTQIGWSVKVFEGTNEATSPGRCLVNDFWDFNKDWYTNSSVHIGQSISMVRVYHNNNCAGTASSEELGGTGGSFSNGLIEIDNTLRHCTDISPFDSDIAYLFNVVNCSGDVTWFSVHDNNGPGASGQQSLYVPNGSVVNVSSNDNNSGDKTCFSATVNNLALIGWQDRIQWAQVVPGGSCQTTNTNVNDYITLGTSNGDVVLHTGETWQNNQNWQVTKIWQHGSTNVTLSHKAGLAPRCWDYDVMNLQNDGDWPQQTASATVSSGTCPGNDAVLCRNDNGTDCKAFTVGEYNLLDTGLNDVFRSIASVGSGKSVMIYRENGSMGTAECYNGSRVPLPAGGDWDLRGQGTNIQVFNQPNCPASEIKAVVMYRDFDQGGPALGLGKQPGVINLTDIPGPINGNDWGASVRIPSGMSLKAYIHTNKGGSVTSCETGQHNWPGEFYRQVSSVELFANTGCIPAMAPLSSNLPGAGWDVGVFNPYGTSVFYTRSGNSDGTFDSSTAVFPWSLNTGNAKIFTGDFNGDGKWDIGAFNPNADSSFFIRWGLGDGTFSGQSQWTWPLNIANTLMQIYSGDFNGDGKWDIGAFNPNGGSKFFTRWGNGDGTFGAQVQWTWALNTSLAKIYTGDFNGDGKWDIGAFNSNGDSKFITRWGNGDGTFGAQVQWAWSLNTTNARIYTGDFNADGKWDIGAFNPNGGSDFFTRWGNGDGTFGAQVQFGWPGINAASAQIYTGNFNPSSVAVVQKVKVGSGWQVFDYLQASTNHSIFARKPDGNLYHYKFNGVGVPWSYTGLIGANWTRFTAIVRSGNNVFVRKSDGILYLYGYDIATNIWSYHGQVGSGWNAFDQITASDGNNIFARQPDGKLFHYKFNGVGVPWSYSGQIGSGWQIFNTITASNNNNIFARTGDALRHYQFNTATLTWTYSGDIASGWQQYNYFFASTGNTLFSRDTSGYLYYQEYTGSWTDFVITGASVSDLVSDMDADAMSPVSLNEFNPSAESGAEVFEADSSVSDPLAAQLQQSIFLPIIQR